MSNKAEQHNADQLKQDWLSARMVPCEECYGNGRVPDSIVWRKPVRTIVCPKCGGDGQEVK